MYPFPGFAALNSGIRGEPFVLDLLTERHGILVLGRRRIHRIRDPVLLGLAEMIHQQVARHGRQPGHERTTLHVVGAQSAIHLNEHFLGEILRVIRRPRETIADIVDAPVIALDNLLPRDCISRDAASHEAVDNLGVFQPALPGTPGYQSETAVRDPAHPRLTSHDDYVVVRPKVRSGPASHYEARNCSRG